MQTYESDANIGNIKILAVDMDKTLLTTSPGVNFWDVSPVTQVPQPFLAK